MDGLGAGVGGFERGQPVAIYGIVGCGVCIACLAGRDNECRRIPPGGIGLSRDGGMAEFVVVPARQLIPIGDHAIAVTRRGLRPGATCVVIGVGGLGHMAVQILAATTAVRIVAVDVREDALRLAREIGAQHTIPPS